MMRAWGAALLVATGPAAQAPGLAPQAPSGVSVSVAVDPSGVARVRESFPAATDSGTGALRVLTQACAQLSPPRFSVDGAPVASSATQRGPWLDWTLDAGAPIAPGASLAITYQVVLGARNASIPLIVPNAPLGAAAGARGAPAVALAVELPTAPGAHPLLPRFSPAGPGRWTARLIALPSVVRADLGRGELPARCGEPGRSGPAGTFGVRFIVFLATLVLWVPLYFWWALRQDRGL